MIRRALIHFLARFRRARKPTGYELPEITSPFAEQERYFVATHRMSGAKVDYTAQSIAYVEQVAHKLLQWHPAETEEGEEVALTEDEWRQQADRFVTMCGSYIGSVTIMTLGGRWHGDPTLRDEMIVEEVGGTEVSIAPFKVASERLLGNGGNLWRWYKNVKAEVERKGKAVSGFR